MFVTRYLNNSNWILHQIYELTQFSNMEKRAYFTGDILGSFDEFAYAILMQSTSERMKAK
jgi:hypothetical protein